MRIVVNRTQTNRSKKKPIFKYTPDVGEFCCNTLAKNSGNIVIFSEWQVLPGLHGRSISLENYKYCPWCGEAFEFIHAYRD
jgi:hypothetical protein